MQGVSHATVPRIRRHSSGLLIGFLSSVFAIAVAAKSGAVEEFHEALFISGLVPAGAIRASAITLLAAEAFVSIGLLFPRARWLAVNLAATLSSLFVSYAIWRVVEGIPAPCHCFGLMLNSGPIESLVVALLTFAASAFLYILMCASRIRST